MSRLVKAEKSLAPNPNQTRLSPVHRPNQTLGRACLVPTSITRALCLVQSLLGHTTGLTKAKGNSDEGLCGLTPLIPNRCDMCPRGHPPPHRADGRRHGTRRGVGSRVGLEPAPRTYNWKGGALTCPHTAPPRGTWARQRQPWVLARPQEGVPAVCAGDSYTSQRDASTGWVAGWGAR